MLSNDFYCKNKDTYPPFKNGFYLEEYFYNKYINENILTKRKYIPCLWTNFQIEFNFHSKKNKMNQELQSFTVEEFQADFDNLIDRVENGESFMITSEHGNAVIIPYNEVVEICEESKVDFDEIIRIHTDHEEGS